MKRIEKKYISQHSKKEQPPKFLSNWKWNKN